MRRVVELRQNVEEAQRQVEELTRRSDELRRRLDAQLAELARQQAALAEAEAQHALTETFWAGGGNLLTGVTDDTLQHIVSFVPSAKDLLRLGLSCVRLGTRSVRDVDVAAAAPAQLWSIVEEEARRRLMKCTDQERGWVPRRERESWLGLMRGVELLRRAAVFGRSHEENSIRSDDGSQATCSAYGRFSPTYYAAASEAVMQVGRHYAQFTVLRNVNMSFGAGLGVIRPDWDVEGEVDAGCVPGHCFYVTDEGFHYPGARDWEGMQAAEEGDRIGLLLDLDQGSMTVYKNDERLGVMVASGLIGPYCWAAELVENGDSVRIEPAEAPASPTPEELARALAYAVAHGSSPP
jgi:hypothetical protein